MERVGDAVVDDGGGAAIAQQDFGDTVGRRVSPVGGAQVAGEDGADGGKLAGEILGDGLGARFQQACRF